MQNDTHSFVIRIWRESAGEDEQASDWRGYIDHIGADNRLYFYELEGITRFIRAEAKLPSEQPGSLWRQLQVWLKGRVKAEG